MRFDAIPSLREYDLMKTTVDLPDATFRQAKALAATRGVTLRRLFTEAIEEQLRRYADGQQAGNGRPPWMAGFGALSDLADEHRRVLGMIKEEFERLVPEGLE